MSRLDLLNVAALTAALGLSMLGGGLLSTNETKKPATAAMADEAETELLPDGRRALRDARGVLVPLADYRRIASGALVSDRVLADLAEPERVIAYSRYAAHTPAAHRYRGKPMIGARDEVEHVLALRPDLLVVSDLVDPNYVARLEEHGVAVFMLGKAQGLATLERDIRTLGQLLGEPARADRYARSLHARMANVALDVPKDARLRVVYLSIYGDKLFAAGADTSYHDVITFAGLVDAVGAADLHGWPELTGEAVLGLDPDLLLTRIGMTAPLCRHPGLELLRACRRAGGVIELDGALLDDPGPAMLEATEVLHEAVFAR